MRVFLLAAIALGLAAPAQAQTVPSAAAAGLTFGHVHLNVSDIEAQNRFWTTYFGGQPFRHGTQAGVKLPGLLILMTQQAPTAGSQGAALDHFGFKVPDLQAFLARVRAGAAGAVTVQNEIIGMEGVPASNMLGPDGVRIEVQENKGQALPAIANHMHFQTPVNEAMLAWYVDNFGVEKAARGRLATSANVPGGMNLSFSSARDPSAPNRGRAVDHLGFEFKDLAAEVRRLQARGVKLEGPVREVPGAGFKSVFITDPAGVPLELTQGLAAY